MRVTIESRVDAESTITMFWDMYRTAFEPLATLAATKQIMSAHEFRALMAEPSVLKFVGWDRNGDPAAMLILATDLRFVPWINPEFYEARYPEHAARSAIFYTLAALVRPNARGSLWFRAVLLEAIKYIAARRAVACIDCCQYNVVDVQIPRLVTRLSESVAEVESGHVDTQNYFTYVYAGLKGHVAPPAQIDLTGDLRSTADLDLTDAATSEGVRR